MPNDTTTLERLTRFSIPEVLSRFRGRMSYRQFDYWCRTGQISLRQAANGSGSRRTVSGAEYLALADVVDENDRLGIAREELASGRYFAARLARYEADLA